MGKVILLTLIVADVEKLMNGNYKPINRIFDIPATRLLDKYGNDAYPGSVASISGNCIFCGVWRIQSSINGYRETFAHYVYGEKHAYIVESRCLMAQGYTFNHTFYWTCLNCGFDYLIGATCYRCKSSCP